MEFILKCMADDYFLGGGGGVGIPRFGGILFGTDGRGGGGGGRGGGTGRGGGEGRGGGCCGLLGIIIFPFYPLLQVSLVELALDFHREPLIL